MPGFTVACYSQRDLPDYALNQAIATGQSGDTRSAMAQLQALCDREDMRNYLLLECANARIHELEDNRNEAVNSFLDTLAKNPVPHEKELLKRKLGELTWPARISCSGIRRKSTDQSEFRQIPVRRNADDPVINDGRHKVTLANHLGLALTWGGFLGLDQAKCHSWRIARLNCNPSSVPD